MKYALMETHECAAPAYTNERFSNEGKGSKLLIYRAGDVNIVQGRNFHWICDGYREAGRIKLRCKI